eukprot:2700887-Amphidinium_carterae.1
MTGTLGCHGSHALSQVSLTQQPFSFNLLEEAVKDGHEWGLAAPAWPVEAGFAGMASSKTCEIHLIDRAEPPLPSGKQ